MNDYLVNFKDDLKKLKKQLSDILKECERQLTWCEDFSPKVSVIKMGYDKGLGMNDFDKDKINTSIPLVQQSIKFTKQIEKIEPLFEKCGLTLDTPNVIIRGTKKYGNGSLEVMGIEGKDSVELLKEKECASKEDNMGDLFEKFIKGDIETVFKLSKVYVNFYIFSWLIEQYLLDLTMIINAIDNDGIKSPINDIGILYCNLIILGIPVDKLNKILGMSIYFNKEYARKNPDYKFKNIDLINNLAKFYNQDGTFKSNLSTTEFNDLLLTLKENSQNYFNLLRALYYLLSSIIKFNYSINFNSYDSIIDNIKNLYEQTKYSEPELKNKDTTKSKILNYKNTIDRDFYKYLDLIYDNKNDRIIAIPDNLEEFYQRLAESNLTQIGKKHIRKLIKECINQINKNAKFIHLSIEQLEIYNKANELLNTLESYNPDKWELNKILGEINDILDIFNTNISNQDREELLQDLSNYLEKLSLICDKYTTKGAAKKIKI